MQFQTLPKLETEAKNSIIVLLGQRTIKML